MERTEYWTICTRRIKDDFWCGDTTTVKVNYKEDQVVVLSNHDPFPKNSAFTSNKKPFTMAFFFLLVKYDIIKNDEVTIEWKKLLHNNDAGDHSSEYDTD